MHHLKIFDIVGVYFELVFMSPSNMWSPLYTHVKENYGSSPKGQGVSCIPVACYVHVC